MNVDEKLKAAQSGAQNAETKMIEFLIASDKLNDLTISDVKQIAYRARELAFDATEDFRLHL